MRQPPSGMAQTSFSLQATYNPSYAARDGPLAPIPSNYYLAKASPKTVTWEKLEAQRLQSLGLSNKYSRHFNVLRSSVGRPQNMMMIDDKLATQGMVPGMERQKSQVGQPDGKQGKSKSNSMAPFSTVGKPTCGFFFSRETDNKKKKFGIPPSDLVKWRNFAPQHTNQ